MFLCSYLNTCIFNSNTRSVQLSVLNVDHSLFFFFSPLHCMSFFDLPFLLSPLLSSNFSLILTTYEHLRNINRTCVRKCYDSCYSYQSRTVLCYISKKAITNYPLPCDIINISFFNLALEYLRRHSGVNSL